VKPGGRFFPGDRTIEPVGLAVRAVRAQKKAPPKSDAVHLMPSEQGFSRIFSENSQKASDVALIRPLLAVFLASSGATPSGSGLFSRSGVFAFSSLEPDRRQKWSGCYIPVSDGPLETLWICP